LARNSTEFVTGNDAPVLLFGAILKATKERGRNSEHVPCEPAGSNGPFAEDKIKDGKVIDPMTRDLIK
jgi:hypothetical protein